MFDISVDQFIHTNSSQGESSCHKQIDILLNAMNEKELIVMRATAEGLKKARETEKGAIFSKDTNYFTLHFVPFIEDSVKWQAGQLWPQLLFLMYWPSGQNAKSACWEGLRCRSGRCWTCATSAQHPQTRLRANLARNVSIALLLILP